MYTEVIFITPISLQWKGAWLWFKYDCILWSKIVFFCFCFFFAISACNMQNRGRNFKKVQQNFLQKGGGGGGADLEISEQGFKVDYKGQS